MSDFDQAIQESLAPVRNHIRLEAFFNMIFLGGGMIYKFTQLPPNYSVEQYPDYVFKWTGFIELAHAAIPIYTFFILAMFLVYRTLPEPDKLAFMRIIICPNVIYILFMSVIEFGVKPYVREETDGFNLSGHAMLRRVLHIMYMINYEWLDRGSG